MAVTPRCVQSDEDAVAGHRLADAPSRSVSEAHAQCALPAIGTSRQLEQRLHRPPTGWPAQPFQVSHGVAGAVGQKFLDETLYGRSGHVSPQIAMILERNGLNDAANKNRNRTTTRNGHVRPIQPVAAEAIIARAFTTLGISGLYAGHHPRNVGSRRLLEGLEFRYTHDDHRRDRSSPAICCEMMICPRPRVVIARDVRPMWRIPLSGNGHRRVVARGRGQQCLDC
jgi:hypothetical protein